MQTNACQRLASIFVNCIPHFHFLHDLLTMTVVLRRLRTAQIAKSRFSFQRCFKILKDRKQMTGLLIEISLPDLCVDSIVQCVCLFALWVDRRSREMCLFVKQFGYNIFMSFLKDINIFENVNSASWPLAAQSKEISANNNRHVYADQHSTREVKKRWLGDHANLKGLKHGDGWLISSNRLCFCFYTEYSDIPYIHTF